MKFFWKVFLCTMLTAVTALSAGGFFLIDSQFRQSLSREISSAFDENELLSYSIGRELRSVEEQLLYAKDTHDETRIRQELLAQAMQSLSFSSGGQKLSFRLTDSGKNAVFDEIGESAELEILDKIDGGTRAYELLRRPNGRAVIHVASPLPADGAAYSVESLRDITYLFETRSSQYQAFALIAGILVAACGVISFLLSHFLTVPVKRLSRAVRRMARGELEQRVPVRSSDEIGALSEDFNWMAQRLSENVAELVESTRRQEEFTASFAHELKTPLTSIIGYADMLRSKRLPEEETMLSANYIFEEGKRLESLSMKLMQLIVLKKQDFVMRDIRADLFFQEVEASMRPLLLREEIFFSAQCEEGTLHLEPDLMKTVCMNLIDNARKSMERGTILLYGRNTPEGYSISVRDDGKGIPPEELTKITEAFYMVDKSRSRAQGGAGLGLAICAEIVQLHGARMDFRSEPGAGTCVTITLKGRGQDNDKAHQ